MVDLVMKSLYSHLGFYHTYEVFLEKVAMLLRMNRSSEIKKMLNIENEGFPPPTNRHF